MDIFKEMMMSQYNTWGDQCVYRTWKKDVKLCDMTEYDMKLNILECDRKNWMASESWVIIFNKELEKRRYIKVQKIINKI